MTSFKIGTTVRLKSGGPVMTVTGVGTDTTKGHTVVWTSWFTKDDQEKTGHFPADAVEEDDGGPVIA